jgi:hypothetical protein
MTGTAPTWRTMTSSDMMVLAPMMGATATMRVSMMMKISSSMRTFN